MQLKRKQFLMQNKGILKKRAVFGYCRGLHYSKEENIFSYLARSAQGMGRTVFSVSVNKYLLPTYFLSSTCCLTQVHSLPHELCFSSAALANGYSGAGHSLECTCFICLKGRW